MDIMRWQVALYTLSVRQVGLELAFRSDIVPLVLIVTQGVLF